MGLPQEYWHDCKLFEISSAIRTPLTLNAATHNRFFGPYARILVVVDFSRCNFDEVLVERDYFAFNLEVVYE